MKIHEICFNSYLEGQQEENERILKIIDGCIAHNGILDKEWEQDLVYILNKIKDKIKQHPNKEGK